MESSSHKEEAEVAVGEAGRGEATLWSHHRSCKPCPARLQIRRQRLHQQEEGIVGEADREGVEHQGSLSVRRQAVASSGAS
jgi:hypothetical protein